MSDTEPSIDDLLFAWKLADPRGVNAQDVPNQRQAFRAWGDQVNAQLSFLRTQLLSEINEMVHECIRTKRDSRTWEDRALKAREENQQLKEGAKALMEKIEDQDRRLRDEGRATASNAAMFKALTDCRRFLGQGSVADHASGVWGAEEVKSVLDEARRALEPRAGTELLETHDREVRALQKELAEARRSLAMVLGGPRE